MAISLAALERPLIEARDKLKVNSGSAGAIQHALSTASSNLSGYSRQHHADATNARGQWRGNRAASFDERHPMVTSDLDGAASWASTTAAKIGNATQVINAARNEVADLIDEFRANVGPLVAIANSSGGDGANKGVALQAKAQAERMAAEYAAAAAKIVSAAKAKVARLGKGGGEPKGTTDTSGALGSRASSGGGSGGGGGSSGGGGGGGGSAPSQGTPVMTPPSSQFGSGTKINLPNGMGTVEAPNERAAIAVRAALTQLGVPYQWGGTSPGQGLDCSGLTQYAYGQAGVELPRHSSDQAMGMKIDQSQIQPGDLIVWDGHVAMYIGDGQMIEEPYTGASCRVVPMKTESSHPFLGFFRPSA